MGLAWRRLLRGLSCSGLIFMLCCTSMLHHLTSEVCFSVLKFLLALISIVDRRKVLRFFFMNLRYVTKLGLLCK